MIVDRAEMQHILGVDEERFRELELAGLPGDRELLRYESAQVIRWYVAYRVRAGLAH